MLTTFDFKADVGISILQIQVRKLKGFSQTFLAYDFQHFPGSITPFADCLSSKQLENKTGRRKHYTCSRCTSLYDARAKSFLGAGISTATS